MGDDATGDVKDVGEFFAEAHVFERGRVVVGGEEVVAVFEVEAFADVFESIGVGPTDTDGFFGEDDGLFALGVEVVFGEDPEDLVGHEEAGEEGVTVDGDGGEDGHREFSIFDF